MTSCVYIGGGEELREEEKERGVISEVNYYSVSAKFILLISYSLLQTDMTQMVEQQVQRKLVKGGASSSSVKRTNTKSKGKKPTAAQPVERQLSIHMIKDSMVF